MTGVAKVLDLEELVAKVEWNGLGAPIRFEPEMWERWSRAEAESTMSAEHRAVLDKIRRIHACSQATALALACTSWGSWQFLGATLYSETHFVGTVLEFVGNELAQHLAFHDWLGRHKFDPDLALVDPAETERFAREWNGPGQVEEYLERMRRAMTSGAAKRP